MYGRRYRRRYRNRRSFMGSISGAIVIFGLVLALSIHSFNLPIFFVALAIATLVSSIGNPGPRGFYGGLHGFFWLLILALFFVTGNPLVFLVGVGISILLGAFMRPILALLLTGGLAAWFANQQSQANYQQPEAGQSPYEPPYQPYEPQPYQQGYQPPHLTTPEAYEEGGTYHQYPPQTAQHYEQPQAEYPQQMPPPSQ